MGKGWSDAADRIRTDNTMAWRKKEKRTKSDVKKTLHKKLKIEQQRITNPIKNRAFTQVAPVGYTVPVPLSPPVVVLINDTNIIWYENSAWIPVDISSINYKTHKWNISPLLNKLSEYEPTLNLRWNCNSHYNTELKTWWPVIGQHEQHGSL